MLKKLGSVGRKSFFYITELMLDDIQIKFLHVKSDI